MLRVGDNPLDRFPEGKPLVDDTGNWLVAHVKSRQEKAFAKELEEAGIPYYLPLIEKTTRRKDNGKPRKSVLPFFTSYFAVAPLPEQRDSLYHEWLERRHRIVNLLPVIEQEQFVKELSQIQKSIALSSDMEILSKYQVGEPVRVASGPLMGMTGEILRQGSQTMFVIKVQMFEQAIKIDVDEACLESL